MQISCGSSLGLDRTLGRAILPIVLLVAACGVDSKDGRSDDPPARGSSSGSSGSASGSSGTSGGTTSGSSGSTGGASSSGGASSGSTSSSGASSSSSSSSGASSGSTSSSGASSSSASSGSSSSSSSGASTSGGNPHSPGNAPVKSAGCGKTATLKTGKQTITSSGQSREYIIDIPPDYDNTKPYRLVFGLHWMGGTMTDVATGQTVPPANTWMYFGLKKLDSPRSAIFVAPQGIGNGWANAATTDATLLDDIIAKVKDDLCVDTTRIFAGGFSYGGMFSSTLACIRTDVFRALAPQNGSGSCGQPKKVAFIAIGSTDGTNKSLQSYARTIAKANGCSDPANQEMPIPAAGSRQHTCTSFTGCPPEYPVRFCAFDEGHKAAPFDGANGDQDDGNKTWVPGEVWKFYTQL